jgi:hypothetical protein
VGKLLACMFDRVVLTLGMIDRESEKLCKCCNEINNYFLGYFQPTYMDVYACIHKYVHIYIDV